MNISDEKNDGNSDFFHEVVMLEQQSQISGFEEGLDAGKSAGFTEGQKLGWEKGATIGSEVGFYSGFAKTILKHMETDSTFKPRAVRPVRKLIQLIEAYSFSDPQNPELQTGLEEIRSKFKQVTAVLGIKPEPLSAGANKGFSF